MDKIIPSNRNYYSIISAYCEEQMSLLFGDDIPEEAMDRLDIELGFVGCYGYGAKYYAAMKLAEKAKKDGIVLGFKGSINSSLIAFLIGLTEINPLPKELGGLGLYDEFFYGVDGDKEPWIDITVGEEHQVPLMNYLSEIFPGFHAEHGYVHDGGLAMHPAKMLIVPDDLSQYPEITLRDGTVLKKDFQSSDYDCNKLEEVFLDFNISVWTVLSEIERLRDLTGEYPGVDVRFNQRVIDKINSKNFENLPELSSEEFQNIFAAVGARNFDDYVRVSNLVHATGAWENNGEKLIADGVATLDEIITSREDVYEYLIEKGIDHKDAVLIAKFVRKGQASRLHKFGEKWAEYTKLLRAHDMPEWYIESCEKIQYLFPKSHTIGYLVHVMRLVYYSLITERDGL